MPTDTSQEQLPELLTLRELAGYLDIPASTLYFWRTRGEGPPGFRVGKQLRFKTAAVNAWLEEQASRSNSDERT